MTAIRSLPLGVAFGAIAILASTMLAVWLSGYLPVFTANRGLLQFVVAIPLAALVTAATLAYSGFLTTSQLLWAMVPVEVIILLGVGVLGPGYAAWPWMLGISAVVCIPWVAGLLIGSAMGQSLRRLSAFAIVLVGASMPASLAAQPAESSTAIQAAPAAGTAAVDLFLPGIVSTRAIEDAGTFGPDGTTFVFSRRQGRWGGAAGSAALYQVEWTGSEWTQPVQLPFSGEHDDGDPFFSPGGRHLFFTSARPVHGDDAGGHDLWVVERTRSGWGEPRHLGDRLNSPGREYSPAVAADGSLWFVSTRDGGLGQGDIYVASRDGDAYSDPANAGPVINSPTGEWNVFVPPDGRFLIFEASGRVTNRSPAGDLYISYRGRVVVAARSAHEVWIVEAGTWRPLRRIPVGRGPHEVAIAPDARFAYTADYGVYPEPHDAPIPAGPITWVEESSGTITEVDLIDPDQRRVITVPECRRNHGILVSRDGSRIWTTCEEEGTVLEIDRARGDVLRTWPTAAGSHTIATAAGDSVLVVANTDAGSVSLIRRHEGRIDEVATGRGAEGLAVAPDGASVWVSNARDGTISVVDLIESRVLRTFPGGGAFPVKLAFAPDGRVWVVNSSSRSITIIDAGTHVVLQTLVFETPPLGITIPRDGNVALVTFPRRNELAVLDLATGQVLAALPGIGEADGLAWIPDR